MREAPPPFSYTSNGSLRIPVTDPKRLPPRDVAALVTEFESVLVRLRAEVSPTPQSGGKCARGQAAA